MTEYGHLLDAAVGLVTGALAGLLGIGGGFVIVPYLLWTQTGAGNLGNAIGAAVLCVLPICFVSSRAHLPVARRDSVLLAEIYRTRYYAAGAALIGSAVAMLIPDRVGSAIFGLLVALSAWGSWTGNLGYVVTKLIPWKRRQLPKLNAGIVAGMGGGLVGGGGAFLTVPYLRFARHFDIKQAISGSAVMTLYIMGGASITALMRSSLTPDSVDVVQVVVIAIAGACGVLGGVALARRVSPAILKKAFALYMALLAAKMLLRAASV